MLLCCLGSSVAGNIGNIYTLECDAESPATVVADLTVTQSVQFCPVASDQKSAHADVCVDPAVRVLVLLLYGVNELLLVGPAAACPMPCHMPTLAAFLVSKHNRTLYLLEMKPSRLMSGYNLTSIFRSNAGYPSSQPLLRCVQQAAYA